MLAYLMFPLNGGDAFNNYIGPVGNVHHGMIVVNEQLGV